MPNRNSQSRTPPKRKKPILSIRARLIVLALLAIAPLMFERFQGLETARANRTERAYAEVSDLARRGAEAQEEVISSVRALLQVVAHVYTRIPFEQNDCSKYLKGLSNNFPWIETISIPSTGRPSPSALAQGRGSKPLITVAPERENEVAPRAGAWIEISSIGVGFGANRRP